MDATQLASSMAKDAMEMRAEQAQAMQCLMMGTALLARNLAEQQKLEQEAAQQAAMQLIVAQLVTQQVAANIAAAQQLAVAFVAAQLIEQQHINEVAAKQEAERVVAKVVKDGGTDVSQANLDALSEIDRRRDSVRDDQQRQKGQPIDSGGDDDAHAVEDAATGLEPSAKSAPFPPSPMSKSMQQTRRSGSEPLVGGNPDIVPSSVSMSTMEKPATKAQMVDIAARPAGGMSLGTAEKGLTGGEPQIDTIEKVEVSDEDTPKIGDVKVRPTSQNHGPMSKKEKVDEGDDGKWEKKPGAFLFWGVLLCCSVLMGPMGGGTGLGFLFAPLQLASFAALPFWKRGTKKVWNPNPKKPEDSLLTTVNNDSLGTSTPDKDGLGTPTLDKDGLGTSTSEDELSRGKKSKPKTEPEIEGEGNGGITPAEVAQQLANMANGLFLSGVVGDLSHGEEDICKAFQDAMRSENSENIRNSMADIAQGVGLVESMQALISSPNPQEHTNDLIDAMAKQMEQLAALPEFASVSNQMKEYATLAKTDPHFREELSSQIAGSIQEIKDTHKIPDALQAFVGAETGNVQGKHVAAHVSTPRQSGAYRD